MQWETEVSGRTTSDFAYDALEYYNGKKTFQALLDVVKDWDSQHPFNKKAINISEYRRKFDAAINLVRLPVCRSRNMLLSFFAFGGEFNHFDFFDKVYPDYKSKGALDRLFVLVSRMLKEKKDEMILDKEKIYRHLREMKLTEVVGQRTGFLVNIQRDEPLVEVDTEDIPLTE